MGATNSVVGTVMVVNSTAPANPSEPSVALAQQGRFLVAWNGSDGVKAQRFTVNGTPDGAEYTLSEPNQYPQRATSLTTDEFDQFFAVWTREHQNGNASGVTGKRITLAYLTEPELAVTDSAGFASDNYISFGPVIVGAGQFTSYVQVQNTGNSTLNLTNLAIDGGSGNFSLPNSNNLTVNPGAAISIPIVFQAIARDRSRPFSDLPTTTQAMFSMATQIRIRTSLRCPARSWLRQQSLR